MFSKINIGVKLNFDANDIDETHENLKFKN